MIVARRFRVLATPLAVQGKVIVVADPDDHEVRDMTRAAPDWKPPSAETAPAVLVICTPELEGEVRGLIEGATPGRPPVERIGAFRVYRCSVCNEPSVNRDGSRNFEPMVRFLNGAKPGVIFCPTHFRDPNAEHCG